MNAHEPGSVRRRVGSARRWMPARQELVAAVMAAILVALAWASIQ